jgi:hypothetical protein
MTYLQTYVVLGLGHIHRLPVHARGNTNDGAFGISQRYGIDGSLDTAELGAAILRYSQLLHIIPHLFTLAPAIPHLVCLVCSASLLVRSVLRSTSLRNQVLECSNN